MTKLPKTLNINLCKILDDDTLDEVFDAITDYLSDEYGYCVNDVSIENDEINVKVDWDTTE